MKVLFLNTSNLDFDSNGEKVKGTSLKFVERKPPKDGSDEQFVPGKQWIKSEDTELVKLANDLVPGEIVELVYELDGKKVFLADIKSTGVLAVDFSSVFEK